ncbi:MAG: hypothetical protein KAH77_00485, partial [Thiomargarita sp.]|nr:hypothetical protein [Thiomargarita sp.]
MSQSAWATCSGSDIIYVDVGASGGTYDGINWGTAYQSLQTALGSVTANITTEIYVAQGIYYPDDAGDRLASFQLANCVSIYGGYPTGGGIRDWIANVTTLSGNIGTVGVDTDNSYHVVVGSATDNTAILSGVTVSGGYADGTAPLNLGAGIYNNAGHPTIFNIIISGNFSADGAGMMNDYSNPSLSNVTISGGNAATNYGGGIYNYYSSPTLTNITISGNITAGLGGGIFNSSSYPTLINTIIWGNQDSSGVNSISNYQSTPNISYSIIEGSGGSGASWQSILGTDSGNNKDEDPLFVIPLIPANTPSIAGNFHLKPNSPAIDAGNNSASNINTTDLDGNPRIINGTLDMGAYEFGTPIDQFFDMTAISASQCVTYTEAAYGLIAIGENGDRDVCTDANNSIVIEGSNIKCLASGGAGNCDFYWDGTTIKTTSSPVDNNGLGPLNITGLNLCAYVADVYTTGTASIIVTIYDYTTLADTSTHTIDLSSVTTAGLHCAQSADFSGSATLNDIGAISMQLSLSNSGDYIILGTASNQGFTPIELIEGSFQLEGNTIVWATAMELENDSFN